MNILGVNGKPVVVGGKVILPPDAGSGVDVRLNAITPDRYQFSSSPFECTLDLSGLITGTYFICGLTFSGERIDKGWLEDYGITISYVNSNPESENNAMVYAGPENAGYQLTTLKSGSDHVYDLTFCLELMKADGGQSTAANSINTIYQSCVVSWN